MLVNSYICLLYTHFKSYNDATKVQFLKQVDVLLSVLLENSIVLKHNSQEKLKFTKEKHFKYTSYVNMLATYSTSLIWSDSFRIKN